mmetsp:Transcript_23167/g.48053  ORF Transcript_23167/g.48053 Transcript_23167/m.48053 type:complete len:948 (-) Transcript_23167:60-2903(-)|eukprot:CAMPEP_0118653440 /NCGR_PEP_ID=MMETSP0785-20121206/11831_1 /TAXON_ID=91992 /ORGANISM="Bolidomonas pacifica, Strain CCMP 1866" /LENGTH=947 /DNA_ID=CAMNT_0006545981 /DNA_START=33 /DNA_END=2879 /DNA_ORIENTATION=+
MAFFLDLSEEQRCDTPILGIPFSVQFSRRDATLDDVSTPLVDPPVVKRVTRAERLKSVVLGRNAEHERRREAARERREEKERRGRREIMRRVEEANERREMRMEAQRSRLEEHHRKVSLLRSPLSSSPYHDSDNGYSSMFSSSPEKSPSSSSVFPPSLTLPSPSTSASPFLAVSHRRVEERLRRAEKRRLKMTESLERKGMEITEREERARTRREERIEKRRRKARGKVERAKEVCRTVGAVRAVQGWVRRKRKNDEVRKELGVMLGVLVRCFERSDFEDVVGAIRGESVVNAARALLEALLPDPAPASRNPRNLLSSLLMTRFPNETMDDGGEEVLSKQVLFVGRRVLKQLKPPSPSLPSLKSHVLALEILFVKWKEADKFKLVNEMRSSGVQTWLVYLTEDFVLKRIDTFPPSPSIEALKVTHEHGREGAKKHIIRLRRALNSVMGDKEKARVVLSEAKKEAQSRIDIEALKAGVDAEIRAADVPTTPSTTPPPSPKAANTPPPIPKTSVKDARGVMANPTLVHRILLQPSTKLHELTLDGADFLPTPTYESTVGEDEGGDIELRIRETMQRVFFDNVRTSIEKGDFDTFDDCVKELFKLVVSLVPSREDLHEALKGQLEKDVDSKSRTRNLIKIARFLVEIESANRATSTTAWLGNANSCDLVGSLQFLLKKAEICHVDLINSKLLQITPFVKASGVNYERAKFAEAYGDGGKDALGVIDWVNRLKRRKVEGSVEDPVEVIFKGTGCIDEVIFSTTRLKLPEVFNLDVPLIMNVRETAKVAGAVCAISVHVSNMVKGRNNEEGARSLYGLLRRPRFVEEDVLGICWRMAGRKLTDGEKETLKGRINGCLQKTDSVAKLFQSRIEDWFRKMLVKKEGVVPEGMRSGLMGGKVRGDLDVVTKHGEEEAKKLGLGVVAGELVEVGVKLKSAVDHMWKVHGDMLSEGW